MPTPSLSGLHTPAAGFDDPFGVLDACHDRVRRSLALLGRLVEHLRRAGPDSSARDAARDVLRYFGIAAPAHHDDEEIHVVPILQARGDDAARAAAVRLLEDHVRIRSAWARLEPLLTALADGAEPRRDALAEATEAFVALHADHLVLEDEVAFPCAAELMARDGPQALQAMGREMALRRGVAVEPAQAGATGKP